MDTRPATRRSVTMYELDALVTLLDYETVTMHYPGMWDASIRSVTLNDFGADVQVRTLDDEVEWLVFRIGEDVEITAPIVTI